MLYPGAHGLDRYTELMTDNPRVREERLLPFVSAKVSTADAHTVDADDGLARSRSDWLGDIDELDLARLTE